MKVKNHIVMLMFRANTKNFVFFLLILSNIIVYDQVNHRHRIFIYKFSSVYFLFILVFTIEHHYFVPIQWAHFIYKHGIFGSPLGLPSLFYLFFLMLFLLFFCIYLFFFVLIIFKVDIFICQNH